MPEEEWERFLRESVTGAAGAPVEPSTRAREAERRLRERSRQPEGWRTYFVPPFGAADEQPADGAHRVDPYDRSKSIDTGNGTTATGDDCATATRPRDCPDSGSEPSKRPEGRERRPFPPPRKWIALIT
ncbi:hypothetical protein AB0D98_30955 [Streptomyces sp. NPDC047987]|uniref:hypothetical protein n=1 Tax=unclassified Streptomyces TaxID=2593676 RepID=UPI0034452085